MTAGAPAPSARPAAGLLSGTASLLGILTCTVALLPFFSESQLVVTVFRHLMAAALVTAIWLDAERRLIPIVVTTIAVVDTIVQWSPLMGGVPPLVERLLTLTFLIATAGYLMRRLWSLGEVAASTLIVATGVYFLLGLSWGVVFSILEMLEPGSFAHACSVEGSGASECRPALGQFPRLSYFSFVTLTTLGYGDVVPLAPRAEGLATMAAVSGQLFMAVLIGRLVGSYFSPRPSENESAAALARHDSSST